MMKTFISLAALIFIAAIKTAHAWSGPGHRIIAAMAEQRLVPEARAEVRRLLAQSGSSTMSDVATWADVRDDPAQRVLSKATSRFHYVNFADASCRYQAARDCADGNCVVAAIDRYAGVLGDRSRADAERLDALRFLVHFVGDAHQPLHAGYRRDRGGNDYQIQFNGKGTNLHAIWDYEVIASRKIGWKKYAQRLQPSTTRTAGGDARDWAEESCRITRDDAIYPVAHTLDKNYIETMRVIAERQLQQAAVRLGDTLNRVLDGRRRQAISAGRSPRRRHARQ